MIAPGAFGKSPSQRTVHPQPELNEAGIEKAQRNRTIFYRALGIIENEYGMSRADVLSWLQDDSKFTGAQEATE